MQIEAQEERACVNTKNELRSANQAQQKGLIPLGAQLICLSALKQKDECYLHPRLMTQKNRELKLTIIIVLTDSKWRGACASAVETSVRESPPPAGKNEEKV